MQLLVLGATGLSGTAITREALERGHEVVAVHRGVTDTMRDVEDPQLVDYVHDRSDGHAALRARGPFDAIIDVSARVPAWVADATRSIDAGSPWWVQLSSVSVYADLAHAGPTEADPVATFDDPVLELHACTDPKVAFSYEWYAPGKAACERLLLEQRARWDRTTVLRPVLITGAHDSTWRFPWWVDHIARGGADGVVVAPPADEPVQVLDARDLAACTLDVIEQRVAGVFNVAPAPGTQTVGSMVEACRAAALAAGLEPARVVHATDAQLAEHGVEPWDDLPAWIPDRSGFRGMVTASTSALEEALGFRARPLVETAAWVLDWIRSGDAGSPPARLDANLERRILAAC
jgi:2'-hydroxyisoflavone reductase